MLHCLLLEGHAPRKVHIAHSTASEAKVFTAPVRVIFFDTGGRLILDGSPVPLYSI